MNELHAGPTELLCGPGRRVGPHTLLNIVDVLRPGPVVVDDGGLDQDHQFALAVGTDFHDFSV